jgi:transposase-like protein
MIAGGKTREPSLERAIQLARPCNNLLRGYNPAQAFPGHGQMKPEQLEIERLRREVNKLKAERDILKNCHGPLPACAR